MNTQTPTESTDREAQARALLCEEANRILIANPCLIACRIQIDTRGGFLDTVVFAQDSLGEWHCGCGTNITGALRSAIAKLKDARTLAAEKREAAAKLLTEAARLEESAA